MEISLPCGRITLIDDEDAGALSGRRWYSDVRKTTVYVRGRTPGQSKGGVYLHQIITDSEKTDHKNGNGLDNRRSNLRACTQAQNCLNVGKKRAYKRFKGVYFDSRRNKWWAQLYIGRCAFFGGYHDTEELAAKAYDALAIKHHGEFALLNYPLGGKSTDR